MPCGQHYDCKRCIKQMDDASDRYIAAMATASLLRLALECEEAYSHARSSSDWMAVLTKAGWDGKSNPRPFINKLRRKALGGAT